MVRMWRHLTLLKRGGRGHHPSGVEATSRGELAVVCPACPIPNVNLPVGWKDDLPNRYAVTDTRKLCIITHFSLLCASYLYTKITSQDANFRLSLRDKATDDPGLGTGWAYFVEENDYQAYLANCGKQTEVWSIEQSTSLGSTES